MGASPLGEGGEGEEGCGKGKNQSSVLYVFYRPVKKRIGQGKGGFFFFFSPNSLSLGVCLSVSLSDVKGRGTGEVLSVTYCGGSVE